MRTIIAKVKGLPLALVSVMVPFCCITCSDQSGIGIDNNTHTVHGVIKNNDGTTAEHVQVKLYPSDFNAYTDIAAQDVDSTVTDEDGVYSLSTRSGGMYSVFCNRADEYCFVDSITVSGSKTFDAGEAVLTTSGSFSGRVQLQDGDDNRQIVILVLGTGIYAMPEDSTGAFSVPGLAEGVYRIRIMTTVKGYGYLDTAVYVTSAENTALGDDMKLVHGVPGIGNVEMAYDIHSMKVTLSWNHSDTANRSSYYVFRNSSLAKDPYAVLPNTSTIFTDDLLLPHPDFEESGDTVRYTIAACGRDGSIGESFTAPDLVRSQFCTPVATLDLETTGLSDIDPFCSFAVDGSGNIFLGEYGQISKIDSTGVVVATYIATETDRSDLYFRKPEADSNGNIYCMHKGQLVKFAPDLTVARTLSAAGFEDGYVKVDPEGYIYLIVQSTIPEDDRCESWVRILVADQDLAPVDTVDARIAESVTMMMQFQFQDFRDGSPLYFGNESSSKWNYYVADDIRFGEVNTINLAPILSGNISDSLISPYKIHRMDNGMTIVSVMLLDSIATQIFFILDESGAFFARFSMSGGFDPTLENYAFDGGDAFYYYDRLQQLVYRCRLVW